MTRCGHNRKGTKIVSEDLNGMDGTWFENEADFKKNECKTWEYTLMDSFQARKILSPKFFSQIPPYTINLVRDLVYPR